MPQRMRRLTQFTFQNEYSFISVSTLEGTLEDVALLIVNSLVHEEVSLYLDDERVLLTGT